MSKSQRKESKKELKEPITFAKRILILREEQLLHLRTETVKIVAIANSVVSQRTNG